MKIKKYYYYIIHMMFILGLFYAFGNFVTTSRKVAFFERRLWAYESWIIFSFYALFLFLTLLEKELRISKIKKVPHLHLSEFKKIMIVNLVLLIFPWGLFLLAAPSHMLSLLGLNSFYWRVLGGMSIGGALLYYFPYRFYKKRLSLYIFYFGAFDNLAAGVVLSYLFLAGKVPLLAWSAAPILFYFAYFFREQVQKYPHIAKAKKK